MKKTYILFISGILMIAAGYMMAKNKITIDSMPPVVVKTFPQAGDISVDSSIKFISVTFSKEMLTKKQYSWVTYTNETVPELTGEYRFLEDKKTAVAGVKLKPGRTYAIWINRGKFNYFKDKKLNSAIPYLLVFKTRD